jgi:hypothetical protein
MQSSQALAQTVFGAIEVLGRLPLLGSIQAEDGLSAFGPALTHTRLVFEKKIDTLGEKSRGATSVDVWFGGPYRVAVECKLAETGFGTCSRTRLNKDDEDYCNGTYTFQAVRHSDRCSLTRAGVRYWSFSQAVFGWAPNLDHSPCPMREPYQLVRNVLAACVSRDKIFDKSIGHALIIYDARNPSMATNGTCNRQWREACNALQVQGVLRRISWQSLVAQFPSDQTLDWLKDKLNEKYGLRP